MVNNEILEEKIIRKIDYDVDLRLLHEIQKQLQFKRIPAQNPAESDLKNKFAAQLRYI